MIVALDTTEIVKDPHCAGTAWRALVNAREAWDVRVVIPLVSYMEAVAGFGRRLDDARVGLDRWAEKHLPPLGLNDVADAAADALGDAAATYGDRLTRTLTEAGAEVVGIPEIPHATLVERAAARRKPCNSKGDGYRDTLNWFTVLGLAEEHPDTTIFWISENSSDFGNPDTPGFNDDLAVELEARSLSGRVHLLSNLADLVLKLATEHAADVGEDVRTIYKHVQRESMSKYIVETILANNIADTLTPSRCGLPITTRRAIIEAVGEGREATLEVRGSVGDDEAVAEFAITADAVLMIELEWYAPTEEMQVELIAQEEGTSYVRVTKPLVFSGIVTLDRFGRPVGGELVRIAAQADDPGLIEWKRKALRDVAARFRGPIISPDLLKGFRAPIIPPDLLKGFRAPIIPPDLLKNLRAPIIPPDLLKNLRLPIFPPSLFKNAIRVESDEVPSEGDTSGGDGDTSPPTHDANDTGAVGGPSEPSGEAETGDGEGTTTEDGETNEGK
jgi:hypothetical protein